MKNHIISVTELKANYQHILRSVYDEKVSYNITKRNKVVATLQPVKKMQVQENPLKGSVIHEGDIISPIEVTWQDG